jgi:acetoacetate decarboxylase
MSDAGNKYRCLISLSYPNDSYYASHMSELHGFMPPLTPTGKSAIIPEMPWYYSGTLLTVEYLTDPANVRAILPPDIDLAPEEPGAVALIWADWQSCSEGGAELLDPIRSQYLETFAVVRCSYEGVTYSRCVAIWVTKDFAIARGWYQGYPKKIGSAHVTRIFNRGKLRLDLKPAQSLAQPCLLTITDWPRQL